MGNATGLAWSADSGIDRLTIADDYRRSGAEFHRLTQTLTADQLKLPTIGTRWTNQELIFHMLFGYLVVRTLLPLVKTFDRLPDRAGTEFARLLNAGTRPFDAVNYWGSRAGSRVFTGSRMEGQWDRVTDSLLRRMAAETEAELARSMVFPTRWDPFFKAPMTLGEVYEYPNQHFWFHHAQLQLPVGSVSASS